MPRLDRIYTKTGDEGMTGLGGGRRVSKDSPRVRAYGTVDELNSAIGVALALELNERLAGELTTIQNELFDLGSDLCWPEDDERRGRIPTVQARHVEQLERLIDELNEVVGPLTNFLLPGGSPGAAQLHVARTICRRAEREAITLSHEEPIGELVLPYLNRLSDALFVMARHENHVRGSPSRSGSPASSGPRRQPTSSRSTGPVGRHRPAERGTTVGDRELRIRRHRSGSGRSRRVATRAASRSRSAPSTSDPRRVTGRPSSSAAVGRSPAAIAARISLLRTARPSSVKGCDDDDIEAVRLAERPDGIRCPAPLEAERRIGRHEQAGELRSRPDGVDERVVRRPADGVVEVLDDRHLDTGRGQPLETLVRVEEQGRRGAGEDLVRVCVEGDDAGPGSPGARPRGPGGPAGRHGRDGGRRTRR